LNQLQLTKASLYVYFGPVAVLVCRRFDLSPSCSTSKEYRWLRGYLYSLVLVHVP